MNQLNQLTTDSIALCTTYDAHDPVLLDGIIPYVDYIEVTPGSITKLENNQLILHPEIIKSLQEKASEVKYLAHGVGLSIGSYEGYQTSYIDLLQALNKAVPLHWHSEHLGYTIVGGEQLNTMLAVPRTKEMLDILIPRIRTIQSLFPFPFLLENIVHLLPDYSNDYSDATFLNILAQETGCQLILDLYNLECDAINYGFDIKAFLKELDMNAVREIHLAGGAEHNGFQLDIHSNVVAQSTIDLSKEVLSKEHQVEIITYEILPQAVKTKGQQMVIDELARLSDIFNISKNEPATLSRKHQGAA